MNYCKKIKLLLSTIFKLSPSYLNLYKQALNFIKLRDTSYIISFYILRPSDSCQDLLEAIQTGQVSWVVPSSADRKCIMWHWGLNKKCCLCSTTGAISLPPPPINKKFWVMKISPQGLEKRPEDTLYIGWTRSIPSTMWSSEYS